MVRQVYAMGERNASVMAHVRKLPHEGWCRASGKLKPRYRSRKLAKQSLAHLRRLPSWEGIGSVYKCHGCGSWHVSHMATFWVE